MTLVGQLAVERLKDLRRNLIESKSADSVNHVYLNPHTVGLKRGLLHLGCSNIPEPSGEVISESLFGGATYEPCTT